FPDMFGHRTPPVRRMSGQRTTAEPQEAKQGSASHVRRSIGEWEAGKPGQSSVEPPPRAAAVVQGTSSATTPPTQKYKNRTTEARACLTTAKTWLGKARNLRTDIKNEVTQLLERMYQLVKEAEASKTGPLEALSQAQPPSDIQVDKISPPDTQEGEAAQASLIREIKQHGKMLQENRVEMDKLKGVLLRQQEVAEEVKMTYASVVAAPPAVPLAAARTPARASLHSAVVSSGEVNDTSGEVIEKIRSAVDAKTSGLRVDRLRKAKDQKVIIACETKEELARLTAKIRDSSQHLQVDEVPNKDPLESQQKTTECR
ncbi:hypothetical protein JYU34_022850, partial [Plutella xylostella]